MFITPELIRRLRTNIHRDPVAAAMTAKIAEAAAYWRSLSDDALWDLMYGPTLQRSWNVWSTGHCPSCKGATPLYAWQFDALARPWKTTCPHCGDVFPKNDFHAYYRSGLDAHGIFQRERANRSLLFNAEHPDANDPLRGYGVDDGWGYVEGATCWRFVAAYLVYGQWRQRVLRGIMNLAAAHVITGDRADAHRALILLDRVADLYPTFDFATQAFVEETSGSAGYVTVWHDACGETGNLALAFECVRDAIGGDAELVAFLAEKARRHGLANPKATAADVRRNIEEGLLRDPLKNTHKIQSNYPNGEVTQMILHGVLGGPEHEAAMGTVLDTVLARATAFDGITGEKGLPSYAAYTIAPLAVILALLERVRPGMLADAMRRFPALRQTFRFHLDTWCRQRFYPQVGDALWFSARAPDYCGFHLAPLRPDQPIGDGLQALLTPSMFDFAGRLHEITDDVGYVQLLYHANGRKTDGLPHDLFATDPDTFRRRTAEAIAAHGADLRLGNVLKRQWCVGLLRSGVGERERTLWASFDSGGSHGHANALTIGLFDKGFDLLPDFGYPPLQFTGWNGPHSMWYRTTASHSTVVVDGQKQSALRNRTAIGGRCTLWGDGRAVAAMRLAAEEVQLANALAEPVALYTAGHDCVGLYAFKPARFTRVRVYTRPTDGSGDWALQFEDDFRRDTLGPDWRSLDGDDRWVVRDGFACGHGTLLCTRSFPGRQRIEYEAETDEPEPCDLSAFLLATPQGLAGGVFFGFGTGMNAGTKLIIHLKEAAWTNDRITPGRRHALVCEADGDALRLRVDGREILRFDADAASVQRAFEATRRRLQYERTLLRLDLSDTDSYYADVFRVVGGHDHAKFTHGTFARLETRGLAPQPAADFGHEAMLRHSRTDPRPAAGWSVDWKLASWHEFVASKSFARVDSNAMPAEPPAGSDLRLRVTELTADVEATLCEAWVALGSYSTKTEAWTPSVIARRRVADAPLASTFVSTIEVFEGQAPIRQVRRLVLGVACRTPNDQAGRNRDGGVAAPGILGDDHVAMEVALADGRADLIISVNARNPLDRKPDPRSEGGVVQSDWGVRLDGDLAVIRRDAAGRVVSVALGCARQLTVGALILTLKPNTEWIELELEDSTARVRSGAPEAIASVTLDGRALRVVPERPRRSL